MNARKQQVFWIGNKGRNTAEVLGPTFRFWEEVQSAFYVGFQMADGYSANCIGRCRSMADFLKRAKHGGVNVLNLQTS